MQPQPSSSRIGASFQILIASASDATARLLEPLQYIVSPEPQEDSGGLFGPKQRVHFHPLDYSILDKVMRSLQSPSPYAVVILEAQPGTETKVEQILTALYHADPEIAVSVLIAEGASLSQTTQELITHTPRLSFTSLSSGVSQVYQTLKILLSAWESRRRLLEMENLRTQSAAHAAAGTARTGTGSAPEAPAMHLEVVGSLAAGIAHEFNNVLTVIQSQVDLAIQQAGTVSGVNGLLEQIMETAKSASTLSRKLVSFTPEDDDAPAAVDIATALDEEVMLLGKTLGDHIRVEVSHAPELPLVWISPASISKLIINIALHAKNSMRQGGVLQVSTAPISLQTGSKHVRLFPEAPHGDYVLLTLEDPNPSDEASPHEPGRVVVTLPSSVQRAADDRLAWIQRTIQAAGGALNVTLLPGMIRTYQMLLPLAPAEALPEATTLQAASSFSEQESEVAPSTVLVVDDDDTICMIMSQVLATRKHRVLTARSADEAWQQWCQHRSTIKLLITDINMPGGANGVTLGHAVQEQDGSVPVIYTSGHRAVHQFAELEIGKNYLPKPFGMNDLLAVANKALLSHGHHGLM